MRLSTQADYAVRVVYELASRPSGTIVQTREIAAAQDAPEGYLAKVVQALARAGLLRTVRGNQGGIVLARPAAEISVREVCEAIEGPTMFHRCAQRVEPCAESPCGTHAFWTRIESLLTHELESTTFAALVSQAPHRDGEAVAHTARGR
jgi:Rrf2 family transcriptional regulator, iron-sulfur cluster assembly transcription factor